MQLLRRGPLLVSVPAGIVGCGTSRSRRLYLVSAHSWRILLTQTFGGMSSMPNWSVLFEICRWSASSALELRVQKPARVAPVSAAPGVVVRRRLEVGPAEQRRNVIEDGPQQCTGGVSVAPAVVVVQLGDQSRELLIIPLRERPVMPPRCGIACQLTRSLVSHMIRSSSMVTRIPLLSGRWPRHAPRPSGI